MPGASSDPLTRPAEIRKLSPEYRRAQWAATLLADLGALLLLALLMPGSRASHPGYALRLVDAPELWREWYPRPLESLDHANGDRTIPRQVTATAEEMR